LRFDRESHGREDIFENVSVSRTSGWFTSLYPLVFKYPTIREPDKVVAAVKDMIRNIPNGGIGYGALRYLNEKENTNKALKSQPNSELLFNYLGNQDRLIQRSSLFQLNGALEIVRDPKSQRPYLLEINAFIHRSCLEVHWSYSMERHQKQTIHRLSKEFIDALKTLLNWYLTGGTDKKDEDQFPLAKLSAGQMKKISRLLDESE
jgi:non-ribosomal peptide synthase protein (TIGR01720 family)